MTGFKIKDFNPRPPWGGRPHLSAHGEMRQIFQSTPSVGRATVYTNALDHSTTISIHALRGEGDLSRVNVINLEVISIHALRGEGDATKGGYIAIHLIFQSTPSVGRATDADFIYSSHSFYFNPRPPWGGRQENVIHAYKHGLNFNPRPPWGGRRELGDN